MAKTHLHSQNLIQRVEVFAKGQPFQQKPKFSVTRQEAGDLIDSGLARRVSKYRIELTAQGENAIKAKTVKMNDLSCKPGQWLLDGNASGKEFAVAVTDEWQAKFKGMGANADWLENAPVWN